MYISNCRIRGSINRLALYLGLEWVVFPPIPKDQRILFFSRDRADFRFLSNFYPCKLDIDGCSWRHTEAYYQSRKSDNPDYHGRILKNSSPVWAKHIGDSRVDSRKISKKSWFRKHPEDLREDWDDIKLSVMKQALESKFSQNLQLQAALIRTHPALLIEDSPSDYYWGVGKDGSGKNNLGILLTEIRSKIIQFGE